MSGPHPLPDREAFEKFAGIIKQHGVMSSLEYDRLLIEDKPSRWKIRQFFPSWNAATAAALEFLGGNGGVAPPPEETQTGPQEAPTDEHVARLMAQIEELTRHVRSNKLTLKGNHFRFGALGDSHIGSLYCDYSLLDFAYKTFKREGISTVFHAGDITDGIKLYRGHEYELEAHGADGQIELVKDRYPFHPGITTYFVAGNHDRVFWKLMGYDIGLKINEVRPDLVYLGFGEADVILGEGKAAATLRLSHPGDGTAYAISYKTQKYCNELPSGTKPDILLVGHYHKVEFLYYRGVLAYQVGCIQSQTPFMRDRKIAAAQGFWIFDVTVAPERVVQVNQTFNPVRS